MAETKAAVKTGSVELGQVSSLPKSRAGRTPNRLPEAVQAFDAVRAGTIVTVKGADRDKVIRQVRSLGDEAGIRVGSRTLDDDTMVVFDRAQVK